MHFLSNTSAVFDFELARPDYCFQSKDNASTNKDINYVIEDMKLLIPCVQLNDKLFLDIGMSNFQPLDGVHFLPIYTLY